LGIYFPKTQTRIAFPESLVYLSTMPSAIDSKPAGYL
jgi:hypothetical protein